MLSFPFSLKRVVIIILYLSFFLLTFLYVTVQLSSGLSDVGSHLFFVEKIMNGTTYVPHPLWHICVHYMKYITLNEKCAAAMVTALFVVFWIVCVQAMYEYLVDYEKKGSYGVILFLSIIFIIGPAYLPTFSKLIITGTGSPNIWHNITLLAVKPFALLSLFFAVLAFEQKKILYFVIALISLIASIFAKPSFVIAFLPALALYILVKRYFSKHDIIYFGILSLVSVAILGYQFTHTYNDGKSSVIIDFLGVWSKYTPSVTISILLALMFPLVYTVLNFKHVKQNNFLILAWLMTFISIGYAALFAESGPRYNHGNFFWSYMISLSILYVFSIADYFRNISHINIVFKVILNLILAWQIVVGLYYFIRILQGHDAAGVFELFQLFK